MQPVASLTLRLQPSPGLLLLLSLAHALAAGAVLTASLPPWLAAGFLLSIGVSLGLERRRSMIATLVLRGDGALDAITPDGRAHSVSVEPQTVVWSFLVLLLYRQENRLRSLALLGDSLAVEDFRQLRLWLRWRAVAATPP